MSQLDEDFQARVDPLRPELLAHCYRMTGARSEAEELVQEALLRAWRGQKGFTGRGSFRAWMFRIATIITIENGQLAMIDCYLDGSYATGAGMEAVLR